METQDWQCKMMTGVLLPFEHPKATGVAHRRLDKDVSQTVLKLKGVHKLCRRERFGRNQRRRLRRAQVGGPAAAIVSPAAGFDSHCRAVLRWSRSTRRPQTVPGRPGIFGVCSVLLHSVLESSEQLLRVGLVGSGQLRVLTAPLQPKLSCTDHVVQNLRVTVTVTVTVTVGPASGIREPHQATAGQGQAE